MIYLDLSRSDEPQERDDDKVKNTFFSFHKELVLEQPLQHLLEVPHMSMQSLSFIVLFSTKKKQPLLMIPVICQCPWMHLSIAFLSGPDWDYGQPLDGTVPERKVMAQSYGLLRDKVVACALLKNSFRLE